MKCEDVSKQVPALVMDELDVEVRREVERHLEGCAPCRAERDTHQRTLEAMRRLPAVESSGARRGDAVAAMTKARDELVERHLMARPSRWALRLTAAAAAALLVLGVGWVTLVPSASWGVSALRGTAMLKRGEESHVLQQDERVRPGDIVSLLHNSAVTLETDEGRVELSGLAKVEIRGRRQILLMDGSLRAETRVELTIANSWNDKLVVRNGVASLVSDLRAIADPVHVEGDRLRVRVERGQGVMRGARGELLLEAGESGRIDPQGKPQN